MNRIWAIAKRKNKLCYPGMSLQPHDLTAEIHDLMLNMSKLERQHALPCERLVFVGIMLSCHTYAFYPMRRKAEPVAANFQENGRRDASWYREAITPRFGGLA